MSQVLRRFCEGAASGAVSVGGSALFAGGSPDNDVVVHGAPRVAVKFERVGEGIRAEAVAAGALRVNGKKPKWCILKPGDRIEIGGEVMIADEADAGFGGSGVTHDALLESFGRFADEVGRERDVKELLRRIIRILFDIIGGDEAFVFELDDSGKPRVFVSSGDDNPESRFSDTIVQEVLAGGSAVCIPNALADPKFSGARSIADLRLSSVLCCPVVAAGKCTGIIYLGSRRSAVSYTERDLAALRLYALMAGMLLNHVEFISQQNRTIRQLEAGRGDLVADSPAMVKVLRDIDSVASSDIGVLLEGETGTGKDLIAQVIHKRSSRADKPFTAVNCSSLRGELLESELYGHKRGAFTGAVRDHDGLFVAADGGTMFLDEISEMDLPLQAKLLRTLETGKTRPVGASTELSVNVRIVCATNRDLAAMVAQGTFRQDLFYRLNQFTIKLPPLRERGNDISLLAYKFLEKYRAQYPARKVADFDPGSLRAMMLYEWPGNVRELSSVVHKAVLTATGPLVELELGVDTSNPAGFEAATREFQKQLIRKALAACDENREAAAKMLGMSRSTFFRYLSTLVNE